MKTIKLVNKTIKYKTSPGKVCTDVLSGCPNTELNEGDIINFVGPLGSLKAVVRFEKDYNRGYDRCCDMCVFGMTNMVDQLGVADCPVINPAASDATSLCTDYSRYLFMYFESVDNILENL